MLQSDWLRAFWSNLQKKIFPKYGICSGTQKIILTFIIEQILWKLLKKDPIFGPFPKFLGQKKFFKNIQFCHAQFHKGFQLYVKIKKKRSNSKEATTQTEGQAEGQKDRPYFKRPFWLLLRVQQVPLQYTNSLLRYSRFEDPMN